MASRKSTTTRATPAPRYFLARAGNQLHDPQLSRAAQRAGAFMKDRATLHCGAHACVGEGDQVDVGSSALAVLAYVELVTAGGEEFRAPALELAEFLRSQQRPDGEFQHFYSVSEQHPIDVQVEYYTGEAAFALSRVQRISGDPRDLEAARRALSFLVARSPWFLGSHYFWGAEHWTCQALGRSLAARARSRCAPVLPRLASRESQPSIRVAARPRAATMAASAAARSWPPA